MYIWRSQRLTFQRETKIWILFYNCTEFYVSTSLDFYGGILLKKSIHVYSREKRKKKDTSKSDKLTISRNLILHRIRILHVNFENGISPTRLNRVAMHKFGCYLIYHVGDNQFAV